MEKNWSSRAKAVFDAYPWTSPEEKARAREEAELVAFGAAVEQEDLPLRVRTWAARQARPCYAWRGESLKAATEAFEKAILSQVLAAHAGNVTAAARALDSTPRIVAYKAKKYNLVKSHNEKQ